MARARIVVEGHGEDGAAPNLVIRLWKDLGLPGEVVWDPKPIRFKALYTQADVGLLCNILRTKPDCDRVLVLRDDEDGCPKDSGPRLGAWIRDAALPFPVAIVLTYREYETLFLASLASLAGKPIVDPTGRKRAGIVEGAVYGGDPQAKRDAKGIVSSFMPPRQPYKPTTDQLALTRYLDFALLRASGLACFGTLERALTFLSTAGPGAVYPPGASAP